MTAIALFRHTEVSADLVKSIVLRESESGSRRMGLLPASAKAGKPSLKTVSGGLKGQALKAFKRRQQKSLTEAVAREVAGITTGGLYGARSITMSKTGILGFSFEPLKEVDASAVSKAAADAARVEVSEKAIVALMGKGATREEAIELLK